MRLVKIKHHILFITVEKNQNLCFSLDEQSASEEDECSKSGKGEGGECFSLHRRKGKVARDCLSDHTIKYKGRPNSRFL
jgi:hypothetical protein